MLKIKALLGKILNWSGFAFDWSDTGTNNTTDTWVPVFNGGKIQHRDIPQGQEFVSAKYTGWGTSCSKADFSTGFVIVNNYLYVVWFASTALVGVVAMLGNGTQRVEGNGSVTIDTVTFTRSGSTLTITNSGNATIRIIG